MCIITKDMDKKKIIFLSITVLSVAALTAASVFVIKKNTDSEKDLPVYTVTFDTKGGTEIAPVEVKEGKKISRPEDPLKTGFHVDNWLKNETPWLFDENVVKEDMTLTVSWAYTQYSITYNFEGGSTSQEYRTTYNVDSSFDLVRPTKDLYLFVGWVDENGNVYNDIKPGTTGDLVLTARWVDNIVVSTSDKAKGNVEVFGDKDNPNKFTVKNIPTNDKYHLFNGWYDNLGNLLSTDSSYTFVINPNEVTYITSQYISSIEEDEWNLEHGVTPLLIEEEQKVQYGLYPQSNVNDSKLIEALEKTEQTSFNNYYYYNREYYVKKKAVLARDNNTEELLDVREFDNGDEIVEGNEYWFKVEPIKWNVLKDSTDNLFLLSEKLIDVQKYDRGSVKTISGKTYMPNNYKYSDVRDWLNGTFIHNAFRFNDSSIQKMLVDNARDTTATPDTEIEYENTLDKITLLSYKDYIDAEYGFNPDASSTNTRYFTTTDFVRASRALYSTEEMHRFSGYCWTRSPIETEENNGYCVTKNNMNGTVNDDYVGYGQTCVQPACTINRIM